MRAQAEAHTQPKHNILDSEITIGSFLWPNGLRRSKIKNQPPTKAVLQQHIRRTSYQANIWNQALNPDSDLPSSANYGWQKGMGWQPLWTTFPEGSHSCHELIHCGH